MIRINGIVIERNHFPDGTQRLLTSDIAKCDNYEIYWKYECDEELVTLMFLTMHLRSNQSNVWITLLLPYIPNARMDRTHSPQEVFTLKHFCEIINSLNFNLVLVMDPHSNVSEALLNHVVVKDITGIIKKVLDKFATKPVLFFPDSGAKKRYDYVIKEFGCKAIYGEKIRDWDTGKILGLEIKTDLQEDIHALIESAPVLMIDDIISYGGTMYYSSKKLKECGAKEIYAYATHAENSVVDHEKGTFIKCLEDGTVTKLFTTNSLFSERHEKIEII